MGLGFRQLFSAGTLATLLAAGCNAVLGIEEAHIAEGFGGAGNASQIPSNLVVPVPTCDVPDAACADCVQTACSTELNGTLDTRQGRTALDTYRGCLGSQCADTQNGGCRENTLPVALGACVAEFCDAACIASSIVSTCQLYCACMEQNCQEQFNGAPLNGNCMSVCLASPLEDMACRWAHCEYATASKPVHCQHAIGVDECPRAGGITVTCTSKRPATWTCSANNECCSDDCNPITEMCN